ncbi:hypothetical protein CEXT_386881 [Caerostris extrusa]|uniref:Uncharacterized protein n=1 Tax=Caerostris extrusa TaxID=172846 RepID=A0AAV4NKW5_CAEEX|nr:hypothetical protein CEXT_386881 [Caerostris extrusa]
MIERQKRVTEVQSSDETDCIAKAWRKKDDENTQKENLKEGHERSFQNICSFNLDHSFILLSFGIIFSPFHSLYSGKTMEEKSGKNSKCNYHL